MSQLRLVPRVFDDFGKLGLPCRPSRVPTDRPRQSQASSRPEPVIEHNIDEEKGPSRFMRYLYQEDLWCSNQVHQLPRLGLL